jgi:hypothetical protein
MAAKKKPAITGLHSQGIVDDIIKIGVKGVRAAVRTTNTNKKYVKRLPKVPVTTKKDAFGMYDSTKQGYKNQGALSYKTNIRRAANDMGTKIKPKPKGK